MEGYMLSETAIDSVLYPVMENIQIQRDRNIFKKIIGKIALLTDS